MSDTISLMIRTDDSGWVAQNAEAGPEPGTAIITIPAGAAERVTLCGNEMIQFDLHVIAKRLPSDALNRMTVVPVAHQTAGPVPDLAPGGGSEYERNRATALAWLEG
jgi:hypothetical protein